MEAETGMMQTEAEGSWQLVEAGRARNGFPPWSLQKEPDLWTP